ncbi:MAG: hypothetical protein EXR79_00635 [Myxococcales bacterium]|nr:hypothetical protein [Myxococcales bacterium]
MPQPSPPKTAVPQRGDSPPPKQRANGAWDRLVACFAAASPVSMSHWNPTTGEVFMLPRGRQRQATSLAFEQRLALETGWVEVPWLESPDAFALADAFAASLAPGRGRVEIVRALAGEKPFRALRCVLDAHPGLRRRYEREVLQEAAFRLVHTSMALGLEHDHPEFARWAREVAELEQSDAAMLVPLPPGAPSPRTVSVPVRALRIGGGEGSCDR